MSNTTKHACHTSTTRTDYLFWGSALLVVASYISYWQLSHIIAPLTWLEHFTHSVFELINTMWWGIALGILMLAILSKIPKEIVTSLLGNKPGFRSIIRASIAGIALDLCSHGILMVASKLYERGCSTGQVIAFLIASPWNSFSLTFILIALIGIKWTLLFILLSFVIAIITGLLFDGLVVRGTLPANPNKVDMPADYHLWQETINAIKYANYSPYSLYRMLIDGCKESQMVLRWILFGVLLAALIRSSINPADFATYVGPTLLGLGTTLLIATILEICSEGSTPIAADIVNRASAPGNGFAFLMAGVSTDYTEIMILKDRTRSWKIALFLPLLTVPQIVTIAWLLNS